MAKFIEIKSGQDKASFQISEIENISQNGNDVEIASSSSKGVIKNASLMNVINEIQSPIRDLNRDSQSNFKSVDVGGTGIEVVENFSFEIDNVPTENSDNLVKSGGVFSFVKDNEFSLEGTQYVFVVANGTDVENAAELQAAYDTAKTMSPSGTNVIAIIAAPGNYNFGASPFVMDEPFVDLVSLDGNKSIVFNSSNNAGTILIQESAVFVKGVDVLNKNFTIINDLLFLRVENCKGGDFSFGGDSSFGSNSLQVSGTFIDCVGGNFSFGAFGVASGNFINCTGGDGSFSSLGTALGIFTNCKGGENSFAGGMTASGIFTNCVGDNSSFGGGGTLSGKLYRCQLTAGTFQTPTGSGKIVLGIDGNDDIINL
jgi:hypothetical protein